MCRAVCSVRVALGPLLQILPILLILLLSWMTMPGANTDGSSVATDFRFTRQHPFTVARETANDIPYFVSAATHHRIQRDPGALRRMEDRVERDYVDLVRVHCQTERSVAALGLSDGSVEWCSLSFPPPSHPFLSPSHSTTPTPSACLSHREEIHKLESQVRTAKVRDRDRAIEALHNRQDRAEWCDRLQRLHAGISI